MEAQVLIADSEPVVRAGLVSFFHRSEIRVVAEVGTIRELLEVAPNVSAGLILLDVSFPDGSGPTAVEKLRALGISARFLFFAADADLAILSRAAAAGVDSFLRKTASPEEILRIVRTLADLGYSPLRSSSRSFAGELRRLYEPSGRRKGTTAGSRSVLTDRETEILLLVASGHGNKEVAASLGLSVDTVKEHLGNIIRKLDASDRTSAAVKAIRYGIIS